MREWGREGVEREEKEREVETERKGDMERGGEREGVAGEKEKEMNVNLNLEDFGSERGGRGVRENKKTERLFVCLFIFPKSLYTYKF